MIEIKPIQLSAPQTQFLSATTDRNLLQCGQGFGKTHIMGVLAALFVTHLPRVLGMITANTLGQLGDSTLFRIFQVFKDHFGWEEWTRNNTDGYFVIGKNPPDDFSPHGYVFKTPYNKIFFRNGAVVMTVSLDNYKAIDGREIGYVLGDEVKDTREQAIKEVILGRLRARGICVRKNYDFHKHFFPFVPEGHPDAGESANPLYFFTSPAKEEWIAEMFQLEKHRVEIESSIFSEDDYFFKRDDGRTILIASTYHNKKNLPAPYIPNLLRDLTKDRADMLVFGSPFGKLGVEYYANYSRSRNVAPCVYRPSFPIHITLDFNVNPYMTLVVCQIVPNGNRWTLQILYEYCLDSPENSIAGVCRAFRDDWEHFCNYGLFYYGDATGKNSLPIEDVKNYYEDVKKQLHGLLNTRSERLLRQNPRHKSLSKGSMGRRDFMNAMLAGSYGIDIIIDPKCKKTIADFEFVKEDANGAKLKKKELINGISCERYGHTSDAIDGLCCYQWGSWAKR